MQRILPVAIVAAVLTACGAPASHVDLPGASIREQPTSLRVQVRENGAIVVRDVALEDYVRATVLSEVDPSIAEASALERMYEVQSIMSRTYAAPAGIMV